MLDSFEVLRNSVNGIIGLISKFSLYASLSVEARDMKYLLNSLAITLRLETFSLSIIKWDLMLDFCLPLISFIISHVFLKLPLCCLNFEPYNFSLAALIVCFNDLL